LNKKKDNSTTTATTTTMTTAAAATATFPGFVLLRTSAATLMMGSWRVGETCFSTPSHAKRNPSRAVGSQGVVTGWSTPQDSNFVLAVAFNDNNNSEEENGEDKQTTTTTTTTTMTTAAVKTAMTTMTAWRRTISRLWLKRSFETPQGRSSE
jgi:hypothetical protein